LLKGKEFCKYEVQIIPAKRVEDSDAEQLFAAIRSPVSAEEQRS
jgi:hypothetical protein